MKANELRIGNYLHDKKERLCIVEGTHRELEHCRIYSIEGCQTTMPISPIPLTEEWLLKFGFKPIPHMTVMNSFTLDIGRDRVISIGCVGTPNEMIFLIEDYSKRVPSQDICVLRNFDYDGRTYVHTLQNIVFSLTNKELTL